MKQHIDTAPVWESYRQDCECPMCLLYNKAETANVGYFLGESVMEPSQRIEVKRAFAPLTLSECTTSAIVWGLR